jgi:ATP-binding cassette subfamily F protein 3
LLGLVCDSFWRVADGVVAAFDGDLDDYASWLRTRSTTRKLGKPGRAEKAAPAISEVAPEERRRLAAAQREREKTSRQRVKHIETRSARIDSELAALDARLADPQTYNGPTQELMRLSQQQAQLRHEKDTLDTEWLQLVERLEA